MQDIFTANSTAVLASFAWSNVLLAFDFDGTLAPIVTDPRRARMRPRTRQLLSTVARHYPCVVVSGRTRNDLMRRLGRIPVCFVFGNHGVEPWAHEETFSATVREWVGRLRAALRRQAGVRVEDKKYSVAIHYRRAPDKISARRAIATAVRDLSDARVVGGEQAVNVLLRNAPDKGIALQKARAMLSCETAIYVGDDDTDESAFASAPADQLLAVRIGGRPLTSSAQFRLNTQMGIDRLLKTLLALRTPAPGGLPVLRRGHARRAIPSRAMPTCFDRD